MSCFSFRASVAAALLLVCASAQTVVINPCADNTLYEDSAGALSNGSGAYLFSGRTGSFGGNKLRRALLKFDVAAHVPPGHAVIAAELRVNCSNSTGTPAQIELRRMTASWGEGTSDAGDPGGSGAGSEIGDATWIHRFHATQNWTTPGGDFASSFSAKITVGSVGSYLWGPTFELRNEVQDMLANPALNFGWMLKSNEQSGAAKRFDSRENGGSEPELHVTYAPAIPAAKTLVGSGCTGTSPLPFLLDASGPPALGDDTFFFSLTQGPPNETAFVYLSTGMAPTPWLVGPGCNVYIDVAGAGIYASLGFPPIEVPLDALGVFYLPAALPADPGLTGFSIALQAVALDAGAAGGFVLTNGLTLFLGV